MLPVIGYGDNAPPRIPHLEAIVQAQRNDELRAHLAEGQQRARAEMGGSVALAVVLGLMIQSLIDPDSALTAAQAVAELRELADDGKREPQHD